MAFTEYESFDAVGLAELIGSGQVTAGEVVKAAIDRIERTNPDLNALVSKRYERALEAVASGPPSGALGGVPFLVKDLSDLAGDPTSMGSRSMRWYVADSTDPLVERFLNAGLVVLGKSSTPEFGLTPYTEPEAFGPTRNPWDLSRTPGGSSGGAGAAVAAGMVPVAHAGDGGGSIRIPASNCGLFGLKPSRGRVPSGTSVFEEWFGMVQSHVITRSVRDSALILDLVHGGRPGDQLAAPTPVRPFRAELGVHPGPLRIGVVTGGIFHDDIDPEVMTGVRNAARLAEGIGHRVERLELPIDRDRLKWAFLVSVVTVVARTISDTAELAGRKRPEPADYELSTWVSGLVGHRLTNLDLADAFAVRDEAARTMGRLMGQYDVIMTSALAAPPLEIGALQPSQAERRMLEGLRRVPAKPALMAAFRQLADVVIAPIPNTPLFNMTGQPAMSVPLHWTPDGLPVGIQFAGRYGDEATLFRLAAQLEHAAPWFDRRPAGA